MENQRDKQLKQQRKEERELNDLKLGVTKLEGKVQEKDKLEKEIVDLKNEVDTTQSQLKVCHMTGSRMQRD